MHEASLAIALGEEILRLLKQEKGKRVRRVTVEIGELSGVDLEAFRFACEALKHSMPEFSEAEIILIPVRACFRCLRCGKDFEGNYLVDCPACGASDKEVLSGEELLLREVELEV